MGDQNHGDNGNGGNTREAESEFIARINRLVQREGGTNEALGTVLAENARYRERNRNLESELTAERAKVPEGAVVLTKEQAQEWAAYQELGKPEEIKTTVEEGRTLAQRLSSTERNMRLREAADVLGWDAETLDTLARTPDGKLYDFEIPTEEVEGEGGEKSKSRVPYIVTDAEKKEKRKLTEHAKDAWAKFMPVLQPEQGTGSAAARLPRQSGGDENRKGPRKEPSSFYNRPKLNN